MSIANISHALITLDQAKTTDWDVIIVGAGMGGSTAAFTLARKGHKILLVDKGQANFLEEHSSNVAEEEEDPEERLAGGRWPTQLNTQIDNQAATPIWAPLGCGIGGTTLLYAAALQRLRAEDLAQQQLPDGRVITWPFSFEEIKPYYQQAEQLFGVRGTEDPLDPDPELGLLPPPPMCDRDRHYFIEFRNAGLHPYRLHVGINYEADCKECGGLICPNDCKREARNSLILPACETGMISILENAEVIKLNADTTRVNAVDIRVAGKTEQVKSNRVVLAAGAYFTPALLLQSRNEHWPNGVANNSNQVGHNLMFHSSDFIAVWAKQKLSIRGPNKTIALRDFYRYEGEKLGEFQSTGMTADYGYTLYALRLMFDQSMFRKISPLRHFLRIPAYIAHKLFGEATIFATIVEDFPYHENRITLDSSSPSGIRVHYNISKELRARNHRMRNLLGQALRSFRILPLNVGLTLNYGHPCGTCKAGLSPHDSVVDKNCKAHGIENLYVADSSFMPTSGGTNPSLTIAANALRVAEAINESF